jgi:hypothetical protein
MIAIANSIVDGQFRPHMYRWRSISFDSARHGDLPLHSSLHSTRAISAPSNSHSCHTVTFTIIHEVLLNAFILEGSGLRIQTQCCFGATAVTSRSLQRRHRSAMREAAAPTAHLRLAHHELPLHASCTAMYDRKTSISVCTCQRHT